MGYFRYKLVFELIIVVRGMVRSVMWLFLEIGFEFSYIRVTWGEGRVEENEDVVKDREWISVSLSNSFVIDVVFIV